MAQLGSEGRDLRDCASLDPQHMQRSKPKRDFAGWAQIGGRGRLAVGLSLDGFVVRARQEFWQALRGALERWDQAIQALNQRVGVGRDERP